MTQADPKARPDIDRALERWRRIRGRIGLAYRGCRLRPVGMTPADAIIFDAIGFLKLGILLSRRILVWTARWLAVLQYSLF